MKRCSTSLVIRELPQWDTTTHPLTAEISKTDDISAEDVGELGPLDTVSEDVTALWQRYGSTLLS